MTIARLVWLTVLALPACALPGLRSGGVDPLIITSPLTLPNAATGVAYTAYQMTATGGTPPYAWDGQPVGTALGSSDADCAGLSMSLDGLITGVPVAPPRSMCVVPIRVTDASGVTATGRFILTIVSPGR